MCRIRLSSPTVRAATSVTPSRACFRGRPSPSPFWVRCSFPRIWLVIATVVIAYFMIRMIGTLGFAIYGEKLSADARRRDWTVGRGRGGAVRLRAVRRPPHRRHPELQGARRDPAPDARRARRAAPRQRAHHPGPRHGGARARRPRQGRGAGRRVRRQVPARARERSSRQHPRRGAGQVLQRGVGRSAGAQDGRRARPRPRSRHDHLVRRRLRHQPVVLLGGRRRSTPPTRVATCASGRRRCSTTTTSGRFPRRSVSRRGSLTPCRSPSSRCRSTTRSPSRPTRSPSTSPSGAAGGIRRSFPRTGTSTSTACSRPARRSARRRSSCRPLADATDGDGFKDAMVNRFHQVKRHAWGAEDVGYIVGQLTDRPSSMRSSTLFRFGQVLHDHVLRVAMWFVLVSVYAHHGVLRDACTGTTWAGTPRSRTTSPCCASCSRPAASAWPRPSSSSCGAARRPMASRRSRRRSRSRCCGRCSPLIGFYLGTHAGARGPDATDVRHPAGLRVTPKFAVTRKRVDLEGLASAALRRSVLLARAEGGSHAHSGHRFGRTRARDRARARRVSAGRSDLRCSRQRRHGRRARHHQRRARLRRCGRSRRVRARERRSISP